MGIILPFRIWDYMNNELPVQVETNRLSDKSNDADVCARQRLHHCYYIYVFIYQFALSNSFRNRVSFSENMRRSLTRYFRLVMRSTPKPKAYPL